MFDTAGRILTEENFHEDGTRARKETCSYDNKNKSPVYAIGEDKLSGDPVKLQRPL